jgi:hypothetical protein
MSAKAGLLFRSYLLVAVLLLLRSASAADMSRIKSDEQVIFFPTAARLSNDGQAWIIPIHGWIFESEQNDFLRGWLVGQIRKVLPENSTQQERQLFEQRLRWFLVDDRQRSDDTLGSRGDPGGSQGAISEKLGRLEGVGELGRDRLGQRRAGGRMIF